MNDPNKHVGSVMRAVSEYTADVLNRDLPVDVAQKGKHHLLDSLAAMVSGSALKPGEAAINYVAPIGGVSEACLIGTQLVIPAANAALANGMMAHADETDDSHEPAFFHPGCAIVPAALAMAERHQRSGVELLRAVVLGYDVGARFTMAIDPRDFYARGFSSHAFGGLFGASAASFALAGLNPQQVRQGFSFTAQQASGLATWVRDEEHIEKAFDFAGMPARNAVVSATMMTSGFSGAADVFSGDRNIFQTFAPNPHVEIMSRGLGVDYEIMNANIKKWSVGSPIQAALDAVEHLLGNESFSPADIDRVVVRLPDREAHIVDDRSMPDVNLQYLISAFLVKGKMDFNISHDYAMMKDMDVMAMRARVELVADAELSKAVPKRQGIVEITLSDGRTMTRRTHAVRGTSDNPMTDSEVEAKARDLVGEVLGITTANSLVQQINTIDKLSDVRNLREFLQVQ